MEVNSLVVSYLFFIHNPADEVHTDGWVLRTGSGDGMQGGSDLKDEVTDRNHDILVLPMEEIDLEGPGVALLRALDVRDRETNVGIELGRSSRRG